MLVAFIPTYYMSQCEHVNAGLTDEWDTKRVIQY